MSLPLLVRCLCTHLHGSSSVNDVFHNEDVLSSDGFDVAEPSDRDLVGGRRVDVRLDTNKFHGHLYAACR